MSNNESISEDNASIPVVHEMIRDICDSTPSSVHNRIDNLVADELLIQQALALPEIHDSTGEFGETTIHSSNSTSEEFKEVIDSTVKRLAISQNNSERSDTYEPAARFSETISVQQIQNLQSQTIQPIDEQSNVASSSTTTTTSNVSKKKPHIMISYNHSSSEICQQIRKDLRESKYKVWMDIYDMRGNIVDGMANAIENSYIVLVCLNHQYELGAWCRREIEDIAERDIKFIPCYMEAPFRLANWLGLLIGRRLWIDFSKDYDISFQKLIQEITAIEEEIFINPRETPPLTPEINFQSRTSSSTTTTILRNPTIAPSTDVILRDFKNWIETNQENLQRLHPKQSSELIQTLIQASRTGNQPVDDHLIQQLLRSNCEHEQNNAFDRLSSNFSFLQSLCIIMALWTARTIYKRA